MMYFIKNLSLPIDIKNHIYSYLDYTKEIKYLEKIWYKRLITDDFYYYSKYCFKCYKTKKIVSLMYILLDKEEKQLEILKSNKAYKIIDNIHKNNLKLLK